MKLTPDHRKHRDDIADSFVREMSLKYSKGAAEHGGHLNDMSLLTLVENALEETIDQYTYLYTLREKLKNELQQ